MQTLDVAIIGGGPSGSSAGLTLLKRQGIRVALIEKSDYSEYRVGETLSPGIRAMLEYLGVWDEFNRTQQLSSFSSSAAWGSEELSTLDYLFTLHGSGWALDRSKFDQMLAHSFQSKGGQLLINTSVSAIEEQVEEHQVQNGWLLKLKNNRSGQESSLRCKFLIDASGRRSFLSRKLNLARVQHDKLVGIGSIVQLAEGHGLTASVQVEACDYGWWYRAPIPGNRLSVVLMIDSDLAKTLKLKDRNKWLDLLKQARLTFSGLESAESFGDICVYPAHTAKLKHSGGSNWVAVGDAAVSHDPLSSSGIPNAIGTGVHGAVVAVDSLFAQGLMLENYQQAVQHDFISYLKTYWNYYSRETRWPDSVFWRRRNQVLAIAANTRIVEVADTLDQNLFKLDSSTFVHLSPSLSQELQSCCKPNLQAYEAVRSFQQRYPNIPDQKIINGLQELASYGLISVEA